jgi:hypothetical protein
MGIETHSAANIFPAMTAAEFGALKADIASHGLREPLWLYQGQILDGRHRARACSDLGIEPDVQEYAGDDPVAFVVSLNLHRRHLDTSQRALVAARLATNTHGGDRRSDQAANLPVVSQPEAASLLNVGERSVRSARTVLDEGIPELVAAVERGELAVSTAAEIAELPAAEQVALIATPHVARNSGENEWYTPQEFIQAAHNAMGGIDCDPASCEQANRVIGAGVYFDKDSNGLEQLWRGRVWMNPPYAQPLIGLFAEAVANKFETGEIEQACVLVNNATETAWFQRMLETAQTLCLPRTRVRFLDPHGRPGAPLQGQAVIYFGQRHAEFRNAFAGFGAIFVRPQS